MKIGLQTWGSNGDIRPMIALADGLQRAGHRVTLCVSSIDNRCYRETCDALAIDYCQVPERIEFDMQDFARRSFKMNAWQWLTTLLDEVFLPYESAIFDAACRLAADNDCLIGHHFVYPLKLAALQQRKPHFSVTYCHAAIATDRYAPFLFPNLGKTLNRWQWELFNRLFDWAFKNKLGRLWQKQGMPPFKHVLTDLLTSQQLDLVAVDSFFCDFRDQRQDAHYVNGFLALPEDAEDWNPPAALNAFLAAGAKPVYMTFGSLQQAVPEWSMDLFVDAAQKAACRAIIQSSSPRYPAGSHSNDLYFIGPHPHLPLFEQCAAVVHHGGAGTTQTATLAGLPSITVPFMDEQLFWGKQLQRLGLSPEPLPAKYADADRLAARLREILASNPMQERARQAQQSLMSVSGVAHAVDLIEQTFETLSRHDNISR